MIHLALWLISAVVVGYFVLLALGLTAVVLADGRWKYVLCGLALIIVVLVVQTNKQNEASAARRDQNQPLQQQCISNAKSGAIKLRQEAIDRGAYTNAYSRQLAVMLENSTANCKSKYPTY